MKKKVYYKLNRYKVAKVEVESVEQEQAVKILNRETDRFAKSEDTYYEKCSSLDEMYEETGLKLEPLKVDPAFEKPYFTTVGMTDESCATVYGYASGEVSKAAQEDSEEIEIILADRTEVKRILKEERVAIMCAYMLMHFLKDEDPFEFLN